jgi:hypothetical protein
MGGSSNASARGEDMRETSPNGTPHNPKLRRNKKEKLMTDLVREQSNYYGEEGGGVPASGVEGLEDMAELQKLYSSEINFDNFEVIKVIGRGCYAKVYLIKKIGKEKGDDQFYALKVLKKKVLYEKELLHHTIQER